MGYNPLILTFDPNFLGHPSRDPGIHKSRGVITLHGLKKRRWQSPRRTSFANIASLSSMVHVPLPQPHAQGYSWVLGNVLGISLQNPLAKWCAHHLGIGICSSLSTVQLRNDWCWRRGSVFSFCVFNKWVRWLLILKRKCPKMCWLRPCGSSVSPLGVLSVQVLPGKR